MTRKNSNPGTPPDAVPVAATDSLAVEAFDYELPTELVAKRPVARGRSRLFVLDRQGEERHRHIRELPELLAEGDALIVNDTRVLPARLFGRRRPGGGRAELLLVERLDARRWQALLRPAKRLGAGSIIELEQDLEATVESPAAEGLATLRFSRPVEALLDDIGHMPLPPYIGRAEDAEDRERYQTVYATEPGAVAAPTAGLHFDEALLARIAARGVEVGRITLHVGIGTFRPIAAADLRDHVMHEERYHLPAATCELLARTRARGGRVVAVGTTVVRTLESAARREGGLAPHSDRTRLFIRPGFDFQVVDSLLTNFHLPRSTLLVLVAAFAGRRRVLDAYAEAAARRYRFYSYGDAMLLRRRTHDV